MVVILHLAIVNLNRTRKIFHINYDTLMHSAVIVETCLSRCSLVKFLLRILLVITKHSESSLIRSIVHIVKVRTLQSDFSTIALLFYSCCELMSVIKNVGVVINERWLPIVYHSIAKPTVLEGRAIYCYICSFIHSCIGVIHIIIRNVLICWCLIYVHLEGFNID
jgi:hypothetical protein